MTDQLPHNAEAERTIIAAVLVNPAVMVSVEEQLQADDFFVASNKRVFKAMQALSLRGAALDLVAVKNELVKLGDGDVAGADLSGVIDGVPRVSNIDGWAEIIREKAIAGAGFGKIEGRRGPWSSSRVPHDIRRTVLRRWKGSGGQLDARMAIAGHDSTETHDWYTGDGPEGLQEFARLLDETRSKEGPGKVTAFNRER